MTPADDNRSGGPRRGPRRPRRQVEGYWRSVEIQRDPERERERSARIAESAERRRTRQAEDAARGLGRRREQLGRQMRGRTIDAVVLIAMIVLALSTGFYVLSQQKASLPGWIPVLGEDFFHLDAEFSSARAVMPGQGQAITISGINVGQVSSVNLADGKAVIGMDIDNKYAQLIHTDATVLLRPKTNLNDMVVDVDPGSGGELIEEGTTIPESQTEPNVNTDEFLASLDSDTRTYLQALIQAGGEGIGGDRKGRQLSAVFRRLYPFTRDIARVNSAVAKRRESLARVVHNFGALTEELARNDSELTRFVASSGQALGDFAAQERSIRAAIQRLPRALETTRGALDSSNRLSQQLRPALDELTPQAHAFAPALRASQRFFAGTEDTVAARLRPFAREVAPTVHKLAPAAKPFSETVAGLRDTLKPLNHGFNELAYNPPGLSEGYLFYLPWLNHNLNAGYLTQDAGGPLRRALVMLSCNTAGLANGFANGRPFLRSLLSLTRAPTPAQAC